jgi:hypothetical protein
VYRLYRIPQRDDSFLFLMAGEWWLHRVFFFVLDSAGLGLFGHHGVYSLGSQGESARTCMSICVCTIFLKKKFAVLVSLVLL